MQRNKSVLSSLEKISNYLGRLLKSRVVQLHLEGGVFVQYLLLHPDKDIAELKEVQQRRMKTVTAKGNLLYTENFGDRLLQETGKAVTIKQ